MDYLEEESQPGTQATGHSETSTEADDDKSKRHVEIIKGKEKQAAEAEHRRLVAEAALDVAYDSSMLLGMDPSIGKEVVKYLHKKGQATTDDYDTLVKILQGSKTEPKEQDIDRLLDEKLRKREETKLFAETDQIVDQWLESVPDDQREEMKAEYQDLLDGRKLTPEKAKKLIDKVEIVFKKKELEEERRDSVRAGMASSGLRKSEASSTKASSTKVKWLKSLGYTPKDLKELGYI